MDFTTLDSHVAKFRTGSPNIAKAFDEVKRLLGGVDARLAELETAEPPPPVPSPVFGTLLPPRLPRSAGPVIECATVQALKGAYETCAPGSILRVTAPLDFQGQQWNVNGRGTPQAPITITGTAPIRNALQWYIPQGGFLILDGLDMSACDVPVKPTGTAHDIEIVRCRFHDNRGQGFLVTAGANRVQVWDSVFERNGDEANLDHNVYWAHGRLEGGAPVNVIGNCVGINPWAYNFQLYSNLQGCIVACCTLDGYQEQPDKRGGMVIGCESAGATSDITVVGLVATRSPFPAVRIYGQPARVQVFDSIEHQTGGWQTGATYTRCVTADPMYTGPGDYRPRAGSPAIGHVAPERYGYVPPLDVTGKPRVTADAGAYAA